MAVEQDGWVTSAQFELAVADGGSIELAYEPRTAKDGSVEPGWVVYLHQGGKRLVVVNDSNRSPKRYKHIAYLLNRLIAMGNFPGIWLPLKAQKNIPENPGA